jgi:hypothetical protein
MGRVCKLTVTLEKIRVQIPWGSDEKCTRAWAELVFRPEPANKNYRWISRDSIHTNTERESVGRRCINLFLILLSGLRLWILLWHANNSPCPALESGEPPKLAIFQADKVQCRTAPAQYPAYNCQPSSSWWKIIYPATKIKTWRMRCSAQAFVAIMHYLYTCIYFPTSRGLSNQSSQELTEQVWTNGKWAHSFKSNNSTWKMPVMLPW